MRAKLLGTAAAVGGLLLWGATAQALTITISMEQIGGTDATGLTQVASGNDAAGFVGSFGNFDINTTSGTGSPPLPSTNLLDSSTTDTTSTGCGLIGCTLDVFVTEKGLTFPTGTALLQTALTWNIPVGDTASNGSDITFTNSVDGSVFNTETGFVFLHSTSFTVTDSVTLPGTYTLTEEYSFTCGPGSCSDAITDQVSVVPEPASIFLLGSGLLGLGAIRRRRRNKAA